MENLGQTAVSENYLEDRIGEKIKGPGQSFKREQEERGSSTVKSSLRIDSSNFRFTLIRSRSFEEEELLPRRKQGKGTDFEKLLASIKDLTSAPGSRYSFVTNESETDNGRIRLVLKRDGVEVASLVMVAGAKEEFIKRLNDFKQPGSQPQKTPPPKQTKPKMEYKYYSKETFIIGDGNSPEKALESLSMQVEDYILNDINNPTNPENWQPSENLKEFIAESIKHFRSKGLNCELDEATIAKLILKEYKEIENYSRQTSRRFFISLGDGTEGKLVVWLEKRCFLQEPPGKSEAELKLQIYAVTPSTPKKRSA